MPNPRLIEVIELKTKRGCGVTYCGDIRHVHEPLREVRQFFEPETGELLAEYDPVTQAGSKREDSDA